MRLSLTASRDLAARDKYQFQWWAVSLVEAQPFQGKKKGADGGIDGLKFSRDLDKKEVLKIIVSVKGGENVGPAMVKDLIATNARDQAEIGFFLTLTEPMYSRTLARARLRVRVAPGFMNRCLENLHSDYAVSQFRQSFRPFRFSAPAAHC